MKWKIKIMGACWVYKLLSEMEFLAEHPDCEDSDALTLPGKREIHFKIGEVSAGTIRHELRHAYTAELCLDSADITAAQMEEIQCTLDQNRWEEMHNLAHKMLVALEKHSKI